MTRSSRFTAILALLALWPTLGWAQATHEGRRGIGVVTTLSGHATVARAALTEPKPLRFKDDVFVRDRIATAERSVVRVLLGGKALVTVRELSALTITEETGRSTVDLRSGKIAVGVVRQRMRPGEVIEIRTPNAIAAVRGTVLVVELIPSGAGYTTRVHVLHGLVEVSDPSNPGAPPAQVGTLESWSRTGSDPSSLTSLAPVAAEQLFSDLRSAPQIAQGPGEFMAAVAAREQANAVAVAEFLAPDGTGSQGGGDEGSASSSGTSGSVASTVTAPVSPDVSTTASIHGGRTATFTTRLYSLTGGHIDVRVGHLVSLTANRLTVQGQAVSLGGTARLDVAGDLVRLAGRSTLSVTRGALLSLSGASTLNLGGALVNFIGTGNILSISNNLCGGSCITIGGLPVLVTGTGSISLNNPVLNPTGTPLTIAPGSAVITVSGSSQVRQGQ